MKKMILAMLFLFAVSPVLAQENMTFGHENQSKSYRVIRVPKNAVVVVNNPPKTTIECQIPSGLINKHVDDLNGMKFNHPVRIIRPGDAVTMDYQEKRVNFILDQQGFIRGIRCG